MISLMGSGLSGLSLSKHSTFTLNYQLVTYIFVTVSNNKISYNAKFNIYKIHEECG